MKSDVVVIGGGVVGCAIACYLSKAGVKVTLLEKEAIGSCSHAPAGLTMANHSLITRATPSSCTKP